MPATKDMILLFQDILSSQLTFAATLPLCSGEKLSSLTEPHLIDGKMFIFLKRPRSVVVGGYTPKYA